MLSPKELSVFTKKHVCNVGYHVRVLVDYEAVGIVAEQQRRGSVEHFYEATDLVDRRAGEAVPAELSVVQKAEHKRSDGGRAHKDAPENSYSTCSRRASYSVRESSHLKEITRAPN